MVHGTTTAADDAQAPQHFDGELPPRLARAVW
jgi:hypothetical protein